MAKTLKDIINVKKSSVIRVFATTHSKYTPEDLDAIQVELSKTPKKK